MKAWLVLTLLCIWLAVIIGPPPLVGCSSLSITEGNGEYDILSYDEIEFSVVGSTKKSYDDFINSLRTHLSSGIPVDKIPLMRAPSNSQQLLDLVNAYVLAYEARGRYYLFKDTKENPLYGSNSYKLHFDGSYRALERVANVSRERIELGIEDLASAVLHLRYWAPPKKDEQSVAKNLLVLIQMVSEAARFTVIENRIGECIENGASFQPGAELADLQTSWKKLSKAVQESVGVNFKTPVTVWTNRKPIKNAEEARTICGLALLLNARSSMFHLQFHDVFEI